MQMKEIFSTKATIQNIFVRRPNKLDKDQVRDKNYYFIPSFSKMDAK